MRQPETSILQRVLQNDDDANAAFALLQEIEQQTRKLRAKCDEQIAAARNKYAANARLEIDGESFPFEEVTAALQQSLLTYAEAQRARLFAKRKTASFDLGEIRIRKRSAKVSLAEGETAQSVLPRVQDPRYKRVKEELDLVSIKSDVEKDLLTTDELEQLGLVYAPGVDEMSVHLK